MKREEAINHIRLVGRTCRGASIFSAEQRTALEAEGNSVLAPYNEEAARALKRRLETALGQDDRAVNNRDEMTQRLVFLIYARPDVLGRPCGYDYNLFVEAGPWDGKVYATKCPLCGSEDKYQAPVFHIEE